MNPMPKPVIHGLVLCLLTVIGVAVVAIEQAKIEHDHPLPDQAMDQGPVVGFSLNTAIAPHIPYLRDGQNDAIEPSMIRYR